MKRIPLKQVTLLCASATFCMAIAASAQIGTNYQPISNYQNFNFEANTPTANDCSPVNGQPIMIFNSKPVIYVNATTGVDDTNHGSLAQPYNGLQFAADNVASGQLVCAQTGTYAPFNIRQSGLNYNNIVRFEVVPGNTATVDLTKTVNGNYSFAGISIGNAYYTDPYTFTYYYTISYVLVSGFYILGPDDAISGQGAFGGWSGASANTGAADQGIYNANCIEVLGSSTRPEAYVPGQNANHIYIIGNHTEGCAGAGIATAFADYVTIDDNTVNDCSWYSIFGSSGISMLDNVDSDTKDPQVKVYSNYLINNSVFNNFEFLPWVKTGTLSNGEGIIIDTNLNSDYTREMFGNPYYNNQEWLKRYTGYTLVENNVVYSNGSGGIEVLASENVDVAYNSLFNNDLNYRECGTQTAPQCYEGEQGRGEIDIYDSLNMNINDNILYSSIYDVPLKQKVTSDILSTTYATTDLLIPYYQQNLRYNPWALGDIWTDGYQPSGSKDFNNLGGDPQFTAGKAYANVFPPPHDFATGQTNTDYTSVNLLPQSSSTSGIYNGWNYLMLPADRNGVARVPTYQTYPVGAYFIPY